MPDIFRRVAGAIGDRALAGQLCRPMARTRRPRDCCVADYGSSNLSVRVTNHVSQLAGSALASRLSARTSLAHCTRNVTPLRGLWHVDGLH